VYGGCAQQPVGGRLLMGQSRARSSRAPRTRPAPTSSALAHPPHVNLMQHLPTRAGSRFEDARWARRAAVARLDKPALTGCVCRAAAAPRPLPTRQRAEEGLREKARGMGGQSCAHGGPRRRLPSVLTAIACCARASMARLWNVAGALRSVGTHNSGFPIGQHCRSHSSGLRRQMLTSSMSL